LIQYTTYEYDAAGNITKAIKGSTTHNYTYGDSNWRDLLTAYDGQSITYDGAGNPTSYYNGTRWTFSWGNGRQLKSANNGTATTSFTYSADGTRTTKVVGGVTHTYYYSGGKLLRETYGSTVLDFFYDAKGTPIAMKQNGAVYYYITNLQGDVVRLVNSQGNTAAYYKYDPYGNATTASGSHATINPLRYRGYYYDTETGLYYCHSRYYDPAIGRWINADATEYLGADGTLHSYNLFAYCENNPVMGNDPEGTWDWGTAFEGASLLATGLMAMAAAATVLTCGAAAPLMVAVATVTAAAGILTSVNGVSEIVEAGTGCNPVRDSWFGGDEESYGVYKDATSAVATIGTAICGAYYTAKGGNVCFVPGTLVHTAEGEIPIETVTAGTKVWAWDEETGDIALKEVIETYANETDELVHVFVNGEEIVSTPTHPFYSPVKGWTDAVHLRAGDILVLVNGEYVVVEKVQHEILEAPVTVYNFNVEDYHTYYVANGVLVHNRCNGNWAEGGRGSSLNNARYHFNEHGAEVGAGTIEEYTKKAMNFANTVISKGKKGYYIDGATPNTYRYIFNGKYIDLSFDGVEHLIVSFGSRYH